MEGQEKKLRRFSFFYCISYKSTYPRSTFIKNVFHYDALNILEKTYLENSRTLRISKVFSFPSYKNKDIYYFKYKSHDIPTC